jgi:hypothetical protein
LYSLGATWLKKLSLSVFTLAILDFNGNLLH